MIACLWLFQLRFDIPGQHGLDILNRLCRGDVLAQMQYVAVRVDTVRLSCLHQGIKRGASLRPVRGVAEQEGLASDHVGADGILGQYVADVQLPVLAVDDQLAPLAEGIADGFACQRLRGYR